jgi:hypothetical protein
MPAENPMLVADDFQAYAMQKFAVRPLSVYAEFRIALSQVPEIQEASHVHL